MSVSSASGFTYQNSALARMMTSSHAALLNPDDDVASVLEFNGPDDGADDPFGSDPDLLAEREINARQGHYVREAEGICTRQESVLEPFDPNEDLSAYPFEEYSRMWFVNHNPPSFEKVVPERPLLGLENEDDVLPALAAWIHILRFMGDLPDVKYNVITNAVRPSTTYLTACATARGSTFDHLLNLSYQESPVIPAQMDQIEDSDDEACEEEVLPPPRPRRESIIRKLMNAVRRTDDEPECPLVDEEGDEDYSVSGFREEVPTTNMEKVHFLVIVGIRRPSLRDEILCQIMNQLTDNPNKTSEMRGWILLALCIGCFAPTTRLSKFLRNFIKKAPPGYDTFIESRLRRTLLTKGRHQTPCWLEMKSAKTLRPIFIKIKLPSNKEIEIMFDPSTTAAEVCKRIAYEVGLQDRTGFSLYMTCFHVVACLGNSDDLLFDAIAHVEQFMYYDMNVPHRKCPWRLYFRKDYHTPHFDPTRDIVTTEYLFRQAVSGVVHGDFRYRTREEVAMYVAQVYYVTHGGDVKDKLLAKLMQTILPPGILNKKRSREEVAKLTKLAMKSSYFYKEWAPALKVKQDMVCYTKYRWPLQNCRFHEARYRSGPVTFKGDLVLAINWTALYIINPRTSQFHKLPYDQISDVKCVCDRLIINGAIYPFKLVLPLKGGDEFIFQTFCQDDVLSTISLMIEETKKLPRVLVDKLKASAPDIPPGTCWKTFNGLHASVVNIEQAIGQNPGNLEPAKDH